MLFDRARPEMWLGPFTFADSSSSSFPSGHTVGAFALAGVLIFGARSLPLRVSAFAVAFAVGISRVIGLRHWASDVVASAMLGLLLGWFFATAFVRQEELAAETDVEVGEGTVGVRRVA